MYTSNPEQPEWTTWDGAPVSREMPHVATVVVYRGVEHGHEFLILHRAHSGPDYEGEWAWTPPYGARLPDEAVDACAQRELKEETGLSIPVEQTGIGSEAWHVYTAEASPEDAIELDAEHDRFEWVAIEAAVSRCAPEQVADSILSVGRHLGVIC